jgi:UDP-2,4-diacetamido-2,4,6-trideoxy-beta-L-altropyranose hydrolase
LIVLRARAGAAIGAGHAMRCLAVALALRDLDCDVALALEDDALAAAPRLATSGIALVGPEPRPCALALLDGYGFTEEDERAWAALGARIAVFEDAPGRLHACDLLIDPAPGRRPADYRAFAPGARLLLGPGYAPVTGAFARARPAALARRARPGPIRRVLVSTGLTDAGGVAAKALEALRSFPAVEAIDLAVGAAAPSLPALRALAEADRRVRLHLDAGDMARLTAEADLGIGAAGTSSWERCALGLPGIVAIAAPNQTGNAAALTEAGAALMVGEAALLRPEMLAGSIAALEPPRVRADMSAAAAALVDARGAERIARVLGEMGRPP